MFKAVIVDDERKICQLIVELGRWKQMDIEVAAICTDGGEALDVILAKKPDIVLTDIRMPVYDGLELIRRVTEEGLSPAFIIISGYKYFEYAYHAFKFGVVDYLLKPIDPEQLNEVLEKTCSILRRQREFSAAEKELKRLSEHLEVSKRKKLFTDLFLHQEAFPADAHCVEEKYGKTFRFPVFRVFFFRTNRDLEEMGSALLVQKIRDTVRDIFSESGSDGQGNFRLCMEAVSGGFGVLVNYPPEFSGQLIRRLQSLYFDLKNLAGMFGCTDVTIGLGREISALEELTVSAADALGAEAAKLVLGGNRIIDSQEQVYSRMTPEMLLTERISRELFASIESFNPDMFSDIWSEIAARMEVFPPLLPETARGVVTMVQEIFASYAENQGMTMELMPFLERWKQEIDQAQGLKAVEVIVNSYGLDIMETFKKRKLSQEKLPIRLAKAWISEHYGEAVTLETVALEVGLSPAYFSSHFRRVEGQTFSEYLTSVRIDAARDLLAATDKTNYEIASAIGYGDEKYFSKVFKKEVGIRPSEYRKLYYRK